MIFFDRKLLIYFTVIAALLIGAFLILNKQDFGKQQSGTYKMRTGTEMKPASGTQALNKTDEQGENNSAEYENSETTELIVLMYHGIRTDSSAQGRYVISPETLINDIEYLKDCGYSFVSVSDLIDFTHERTKLTRKSAMITFDDGYYNFYLYAFPILKRFGVPGVLSVIGKQSYLASSNNERQSAAYSHVNYAQLKEMLDSGLIEIGNHSYDMHTQPGAILKKSKESPEDYESRVRGDIQAAQELLLKECNYRPYIFAYPFGSADSDAKRIVEQMEFSATFSCEEGVNEIKYGDVLFDLKRYNRPEGGSVEGVIQGLEK